MRISAMVALDSKRAIGKDNQLLFKIPADFARMKRLTSGHPVIMGRKTYESIGHPLPNRLNIIITRNSNFHQEGVTITHSLDEALEIAKEVEESRVKSQESSNPQDHNSLFLIHNSDESEVFIFGGGQIFQEAMPLLNRLYITLVNKDFGGDTFFPDYSAFTKFIEKEERTDWEYPYTFLTLEK